MTTFRGQVPWAKNSPHPYLQDWLENSIPQGKGGSALVTGCGLGDDAEALAELGYQVTAFDISPTAIAWCKERFPNSKVTYLVADLFNLPSTWKDNFDWCMNAVTFKSYPIKIRGKVISAIAQCQAYARSNTSRLRI